MRLACPEEPGQRRVKATAAKLFAAIRANDLTSVGKMLRGRGRLGRQGCVRRYAPDVRRVVWQ